VDESVAVINNPSTDREDGLETVTQKKPMFVDPVDRIRRWLFRSGIHATLFKISGLTAENILRAAEKLNADMIVIGSHPHGKFFRLLFGDVNESLLHHARCPVIVVPRSVKSDTVRRFFNETGEGTDRSMTETIDCTA
jgi:nucleotide-binding universal stress UspA family protein